jgi:hypothetical protein
VDVLPCLLAHRPQELIVALRQIHQQRAARLHEHWRRVHARAREGRADRCVVRRLGIAKEARAALAREGRAHRGDRVGESFGGDERTARRVRDG